MKLNENLFLSDTKVIEFKHFCESVKKRDIYSTPIVDCIFRKYMKDKFFEDIKTYGTKKVVLPKELEEKYFKNISEYKNYTRWYDNWVALAVK